MLTPTEALLRRERLLVWFCLGVICLLSWWYLLDGAGTGMSTLAMTTWQFPPPVYRHMGDGQWPLDYWLIMLVMWWVMMIAMMIPSAAPMVLLYARVYRHNHKDQAATVLVPTAAFVGGYLLAWLLFSLLATALQWLLERQGLVHGMMMWSNSRTLSALFLLAAGAYQLSPLKNTCLDHCRNPVSFLSSHWRKGRLGAWRMGLDHGLYCVGCCWFLMLLLFVGGIMNLVWIAGLAIIVLLEKLLPRGRQLAQLSGAIMLVSGCWLLMI